VAKWTEKKEMLDELVKLASSPKVLSSSLLLSSLELSDTTIYEP